MSSSTAPSHAVKATDRYSVFLMLLQFPIVCFTLALLTDLAYWQTSYLMWTEFSAWLLLAGITMGCAALVFGVAINLLRRHEPPVGWLHLGVVLFLLILALFNNLVHARDGWTSVVPWGLTLSVLMMLVIMALPWVEFARLRIEHRRRRP
jgi:uncharacterized membrane protein